MLVIDTDTDTERSLKSLSCPLTLGSGSYSALITSPPNFCKVVHVWFALVIRESLLVCSTLATDMLNLFTNFLL
jgi:hypothetical protein